MCVFYLMTGLLTSVLAAAGSLMAGHAALFALLLASVCGSLSVLAMAGFVARTHPDDMLD